MPLESIWRIKLPQLTITLLFQNHFYSWDRSSRLPMSPCRGCFFFRSVTRLVICRGRRACLCWRIAGTSSPMHCICGDRKYSFLTLVFCTRFLFIRHVLFFFEAKRLGSEKPCFIVYRSRLGLRQLWCDQCATRRYTRAFPLLSSQLDLRALSLCSYRARR